MIIKVDINMTHVIKNRIFNGKVHIILFFFAVSSDLHDADTHCRSLLYNKVSEYQLNLKIQLSPSFKATLSDSLGQIPLALCSSLVKIGSG